MMEKESEGPISAVEEMVDGAQAPVKRVAAVSRK
jgi:hypothetical protein